MVGKVLIFIFVCIRMGFYSYSSEGKKRERKTWRKNSCAKLFSFSFAVTSFSPFFSSFHCDVWLKIGDRWSEMTEVRNDEWPFREAFFTAYPYYACTIYVYNAVNYELVLSKKSNAYHLRRTISHQFAYCNAFISFVLNTKHFFVSNMFEYFELMLDIVPCATVHNS